MSAIDYPATIWVCQGPPRCDLEGDAAISAQQAGCIWCQRLVVEEDGSETWFGPGEVCN